jgi:DNA-binding NarL/FixJ family response regulator
MAVHTSSTKVRLLIIEDSQLTGRALERTFKSLGYEVVWTRGSSTALELLRQAIFDVIIADLVMPQLQGVELIREIWRESHHIPIVVFSGYINVDLAVRCIKAGASHVVEKSEDVSKVIEAVQDVGSAARDTQARQRTPVERADTKTLFWKHLARARIAWKLTDIEAEVLGGIINDKATKVMAVELEHSQRWVESVIKNLLIKATARSRIELLNKFWVTLRD